MDDFLLFIDDLAGRFPVHVEIYYSHIMDWCIKVYKKGAADEYPESMSDAANNAILCHVQSNDLQLAFARAHVCVKEWLLENNGGY